MAEIGNKALRNTYTNEDKKKSQDNEPEKLTMRQLFSHLIKRDVAPLNKSPDLQPKNPPMVEKPKPKAENTGWVLRMDDWLVEYEREMDTKEDLLKASLLSEEDQEKKTKLYNFYLGNAYPVREKTTKRYSKNASELDMNDEDPIRDSKSGFNTESNDFDKEELSIKSKNSYPQKSHVEEAKEAPFGNIYPSKKVPKDLCLAGIRFDEMRLIRKFNKRTGINGIYFEKKKESPSRQFGVQEHRQNEEDSPDQDD
eukprot:GHVP01047847.1.p1 GENE.GHVP01047847.1~~GHVP01047847.1.p1  ORF type:complete len:254 (+),score=61.29 GHVP01047847.1:216-977(+)